MILISLVKSNIVEPLPDITKSPYSWREFFKSRNVGFNLNVASSKSLWRTDGKSLFNIYDTSFIEGAVLYNLILLNTSFVETKILGYIIKTSLLIL